ncbi:hypothetical protein C7T94_03230 [Pedobacter yulinensis]|uniref:Asparagine synthetase B n=1 Tax=Pedobacter yulinensis TaxID=2126353 RepID=A0A2T3HSA6_9SPHI|nr:DUF2911 domain-containing protein [Pedobacter yulinensis]PST85309.1 hypothetical protein C7T94_03230 [Pedobacter yulinensis]
MKRLFLILFISASALFASAQETKFPILDSSPADILYYPLNVAKDKSTEATPVVRVIYSRPQKKGREIFGVLEQFGNVWRAGANESTEIRFYKSVKLNGKKISKGNYSLFVIPQKDKWTIIINRQTDKWGAFSYDASKDVLRTDVNIRKSAKVIQALSMTFEDTASGANLVIGWDDTIVAVPFSFKK